MFKNVLQICAIVGVLNVRFIRCILPGYLNSNIRYSQLKLATDVLQDKVSVNSLKSAVQGFDFNEDEMQKLKLWDRGVVPYYIDTVSYDKVLRDRIRIFLDVTNKLSGLQFLEMPSPPLEPSTRWVFFVNRRGQLQCSDHSLHNFTTEGVQKVLLGYDCVTNKRELAKIVLLLAGIPPQHNSPDRDAFIEVNLDKIMPEKKYLFEKVQDSDWLFHSLPYDFSSASHYNFLEHTIDGGATISPKNAVDVSVGEGDGFSFYDILKIRMLYNYIRKPKLGDIGPSCKKLFKPGVNLETKYPLSNADNNYGLPKRKPEKYLVANNYKDDGKQYDDDEEESSHEEDEVDEKSENEVGPQNDDDVNSDEITPKVNAGDVKSSDENSYGNKSTIENVVQNKNSDNSNSFENNNNNRIVQTKKRKNVTPLNYDPLNVLSDYDTDDNKNKRIRGK